jgi:hypothetical protein
MPLLSNSFVVRLCWRVVDSCTSACDLSNNRIIREEGVGKG